MTHLKGRCSCGRYIHFPKWARHGYKWRCTRCGTVWVLSDKGDPLERTSSKPPKRPRPRRSHKQRAPGSPEGCLGGLILVLSTLAVSAWGGLETMLSSALDFVGRMNTRMMKEMEQRSIKRDGVTGGDGDDGDAGADVADGGGDRGSPAGGNRE